MVLSLRSPQVPSDSHSGLVLLGLLSPVLESCFPAAESVVGRMWTHRWAILSIGLG